MGVFGNRRLLLLSRAFGKKEVQCMYAYEKAILKTYRQTEAFIKSTEKAIEKVAYSSGVSRRPAIHIAEEILELKMQKAELEYLKEAVLKTLSEMKPCHSYILGVKYGIGSLGVGQTLEKTDGYYKKAAYALGKFVFGMKSKGYSNSVYEDLCKKYNYIKVVYEGIVKVEETIKKSGNLLVGNNNFKNKKIGFPCKKG